MESRRATTISQLRLRTKAARASLKGSAANAALARRGFGEERLLTPLWQRLEQKENPAQQARRIFAEQGVERLIERSAIHPV